MASENEQDMPVNESDAVDAERRAALVQMGKYAAFGAPAVVTLLTADAAAAWKGSGPVRPRRPKPVRSRPKPARPRRPTRIGRLFKRR